VAKLRTEQVLSALIALSRLAAIPGSPAPSGKLPELGSLLVAAECHDTAGFVAKTLLSHYAEQLSDDLLEGLPLYLEGVRIDAGRAETQLAELLSLLAGRGLPVMPIKGPLLARSCYPDATLRPCLDLDLMVHSDDVGHVVGALIEAGFAHQIGLGADEIAALRRYAGEYILFRPNSLPVEPHWSPAPWTMAFDVDVEALWRRAKPAEFLGALCYLPSPEDHLFLLALHGAKEQWHRLKWLLDVAVFLSAHPSVDLEGLRTMAAAQGCRRAVDLALLLSHQLFSIPAAAPAADAATKRLAVEVLERLERGADVPPGPYRITRFHWRLHEQRRDRASYAVRTLLTPRVPHYRRLPLPSGLRWLYVPLKLPWDNVVTPTLHLVRRLRHLPQK